MATIVEMNLPGYPAVTIQDRADAEQFVKILNRSGIAVNLRNVADKLDPKPYKCTECSDRFATPKTFDEGQGHQTIFSARTGYSTDRTKYPREHDGVFPEGSAEDLAGQKANRGF